MLSPSSHALARQAPPVRPSRSLEGLEQVIPPRPPLSPIRPLLHLDKPLPQLPSKPLPDTPSLTGSTPWSDDSSTVNSFEEDDYEDDEGHRRQSSVSTESYPVFVRSGSDDLADFVDHPAVSTFHRVEPDEKRITSSSWAIHTLLAENRYNRPPHWASSRVGPNHYFREKKWDFFPELATPPSTLHQNAPHLPPKPRKKDSGRLNNLVPAAFDFSSKHRGRWSPPDKGSLHDVRNSIRSYVQRRISRHSVEKEKSKRKLRPATAPSECTRKYTPPQRTAPSTSDRSDYGRSTAPQAPPLLEVGEKTLQIISVPSTASSSAGESEKQPNPIIPFNGTKQLAVPITPYQKYGAAIWDKSGKEKRISYRQTHKVRFPKYRKPAKNGFVSSATPPLSHPARSQLQQSTRDCVRALQDGTSQVLVAIEGARKKMIGSKIDRRRTQLKSQIRLIGPVNPYTTYGADPWV
ncbi:hypothetical protein ARAM_004627 [Aspergillus rambellii]|uniref:Uncharacterized protein n=1 Tax=Aspergillus rambellii TaxID=308745 RepID=A0A0F8UAK9_9EURO|nr:hypothetical protein ARAM_004627 [Aspergillus rambellii]